MTARNSLDTGACETAENYTYDAGYHAIQDLLKTAKVDALFCGDDVIGMDAPSAARDAGIRVPEELGIIGFNDMDMAS